MMDTPIHFEDFGGQGPLLHFAHPNAYPPACFAPMLNPLTAHFRVVAMHHRPLWPGSEPREFQDWQLVADDLSRFLDQQGYEQIVGVGHSLGAVATMKVAYQRPELFKALVLIEPVFLEPQILQLLEDNPAMTEEFPMVRKTLKRRTHWPDRQTAFEHLRTKRVFGRWSDDTVWAYINGALVDTDGGEVTLAFSREWEVQFYRRYPSQVWEEIPRVPQPTLAIRGAESDVISERAWQLWQELQSGAHFLEMPDVGHMLPMERPDDVAAAITSFAERL